MTKWTTRTLPEFTRQYGIEELHSVYFAPKGWAGSGPTVSLGIPECELICTTFGSDGKPFAVVNQPKVNRNIDHWTRFACEMAVEQQAFAVFTCDTAAEAKMMAKKAARMLPGYQRIAAERMDDPTTRVAEKLS